MTQTPEALRLARIMRDGTSFANEDYTQTADMLERQHARIAELEAQLEAIGAGGVEPLRSRRCLHQIVEPAADGWLQDGGMLYRLTDERRPQNRDEINVTMADGSRSKEACARPAGELLDCIRAALPQADSVLEDAASQVEHLGVENHRLRRTMQKIMARLADLLDEDQFGNLERIVTEAGVEPPEPAGEYPPLPKPNIQRGGFPNLFTEDQMRAYVDADRTLRAQAAPQQEPVAQGDALDAARYRCLRAMATQQADSLGPIFRIDVRRSAPYLFNFDAAIDAAMQRTSGSKK